MKSYIITKYDALNAMQTEWNRLARPFENPLFNHEWFVSCAEAFYSEHDLRTVVIESLDGISAIAPLAAVKRNGIEWLEIIGSSMLGEPGGFLYDNEESLYNLLIAVFDLRRPVLLNRIPYGTLLAKALKKATKYRGFAVKRSSAGSRAVFIGSDWDEYYRSLSPQRRYDIKRARGRAEVAGEVSVVVFCPEPDELVRHLKIAFRIEASGWKGIKGSSLMSNKEIGNFFSIYAARASKEKILRLCFLSVGEKAIAMQIGVEFADRLWVLKIGYDELWSRCSPGMLLTMEAIRYAFTKGLKSYEFLGSDEPWLRTWTGEKREFTSIGVYPFAPIGLFSFGVDAGLYLATRIFKAGSNRPAKLSLN